MLEAKSITLIDGTNFKIDKLYSNFHNKLLFKASDNKTYLILLDKILYQEIDMDRYKL